MKILIPIDEKKGIDSKLSEHFGHCPYFGIYEIETKELQIIENKLDHSNSLLSPVDQIMKFKPNLIFSKGMGGKAIKLFKEKGIDIKTGEYETIKEVIENLNNLNELKKSCID